jgi:ADP-heptose:LPS heptosyltransferase
VSEFGIERIAVLRATALGDFVFCVPALLALRAAYPRAEICLLGRPWHASFLRDRPGPVDRVIVVPPSRGVRDEPGVSEDGPGLEAFFARMRAERFDVALQMHGGGRWSNPFATRLGARLTVGCRASDAPALDRWIPYVYRQPEIARCLEVAALIGASPVTLEPAISVLAADLEEATPLTSTSPFAVLHPGATTPRRRWSPEHFATVGDALAAEGLRVVVTGTGLERSLLDSVVAAMKAPAQTVCDELSLGGLAALLSRAEVVVSNDTGPLHLAGAVGAPTVGIFWIGDLVNSGPLSRAKHRPVASFRVECPVCGTPNVDTSCGHDVSFLDDAPVGAVLEAALELAKGP